MQYKICASRFEASNKALPCPLSFFSLLFALCGLIRSNQYFQATHFFPDNSGKPGESKQIMDMHAHATDLTKRPPRGPRVRLGGYALLARMLDKGRATLAGLHGDYHYNCPLDQRLTEFLGIDAEELKKQLAQGKGDLEILQWIQANAKKKHTEAEIDTWSREQERRTPGDAESQEHFNELLAEAAPARKDIKSWVELLDLDDYVSFGGKP